MRRRTVNLLHGRMPDSEVPVYLVDAPALFNRPGNPYTREDGSQGMLPTGLAMGYSPEYEYRSSNLPLLEDEILGGQAGG